MSYLLDFIKTFDEKEWLEFRKLDLAGKEELVRDAYARNAKSNSFSEHKLPTALQISQAHFDKINSILLDKTIHQLYGNDYVVSLRSLHKKGLSQLMLHELKIMERSVLKARDARQQKNTFLSGCIRKSSQHVSPRLQFQAHRLIRQKILAVTWQKKEHC